jgi:hypothetical protein
MTEKQVMNVLMNILCIHYDKVKGLPLAEDRIHWQASVLVTLQLRVKLAGKQSLLRSHYKTSLFIE